MTPAASGLAVRSLSPTERRDSGIDGGLVVEDVAGPAAKVGIQPGDVILSINGTPISSAEQLRALVAKSGKQVALLVQRDDARIFIPLTWLTAKAATELVTELTAKLTPS